MNSISRKLKRILRLSNYPVYLLLAAIPLLNSSHTSAQSEFLWFYGTGQSDQGVSAMEAQDGGFIVSSNSYGNLLGTGSVNNLLIKVDSAGAIEWAHAADTNSSNETNVVVEDLTDSSFIVAGYEAGGQTQNYPYGNVWFHKVDKNGNTVWSRVFGGDGNAVTAYDEIYDVIRTHDGNFMAIGFSDANSYSAGHGAYDCIVYKFDGSGNLIWAKAYGDADYDWGHTIIPTSDGNYVIAGMHSDLSSFDIMMIKINPSGTPIWSYSFGGNGTSRMGSQFANYGNTRPSHAALRETSDGGYVAVGYTDGYGAGLEDLFALKVNSSGTLQWANAYGAASGREYGSGVVELADGDLMISGATLGPLSGSNNDVLLMRLESDGDFIWAKSFESTAAGGPNEYSGGIEATSDGALILTGTMNNSVTDGNDIFLWKTDTAGAADTCTTLGAFAVTNQTPTVTNIMPSLTITNLGLVAEINVSPVLMTAGLHGLVSLTETQLCSMPDPSGCSLTVGLGADTAICQGDNIILDAGNPGLTFLWQDNSTNQTLTASSAGLYWVEVDDGMGCTERDSIVISINSLPNVTLSAFSDVCVDASTFNLTGGSPAGGTYSGTGVSAGQFNPSVAGVGSHSITYTYTDGNGCTNQDSENITVNALPTVTLSAFSDVCVDATTFALSGGSPAGGSYSGTGVSGGMFNPAVAGVGSHTITYTYTDGNGCTNQDSESITVNALPNVSLSAFSDVCIDAAPFALSGGSPAGGNYSGPGVSAGNFNPATAGSGTHSITYTYTDGNGCSDQASQNITVNALPNVSLAAFADVCVDAAVFTLTGGTPVGGSYSGAGVSGGQFNPATAGVGSHTITYTYTDGNGCTNQDSESITVNALPNVSLSAFSDVCVDATPFALSGGSPVGGSYSGTGVSGGTFNPASAGVGSHIITYTYTDGNGCTNQDSESITVNSLPSVSLSAFSDVCVDAAQFALSGGSPAGGTYSGTGVSGGMFNPATAGVGSHPITYSYTDGNGCSGQAVQNITVNALPNVSLTPFSDVCVDAGILTLSGGTPAGGSYSGTGVSGGQFDPSAAGVGSHPITYSYTDGNGCANQAVQNITVNALPTVTFAPLADVCADAAAFNLTGGNPSPGTYSGTGVSGGQFDPTVAGVGSHSITYMYTDGNGCTDQASQNIQVNALDDPGFNYTSSTFCVSGTDPVATITGLTGGMFSISPSGTIDSGSGEIDLDATGTGSYNVTYLTNGTCPTSLTIGITITTSPDATFTFNDPFCEGGSNPLPNFGAGASAGTFSATPAGLVFVNVNTGEIDLMASNPGTYTITNDIPASGGCAAASFSTTVQIDSLDDPVFNYSSSTYCVGDTNQTPVVNTPGGTFSEISGNIVFANTSTGEIDIAASTVGGPYLIQYTTAGPCPATSSVSITITSGFEATIQGAGPFCSTDAQVQLTAVDGGGTWSGPGIVDANNGFFDPATAGAGMHEVVYTITGGCGDVDTAQVEVLASPAVDAGSDVTICPGDSVDLLATGAIDYLWSTGDSTAGIQVVPTTDTWYFVTGSDSTACTATDSVLVSVSTGSSAIALNDSGIAEHGIPTNFQVYTNDIGNPQSVTIITNATNGTTTIESDGSISYFPDEGFAGFDTVIYVICDAFCTGVCDTAMLRIEVQWSDLFIPGGISTNGDGLNDVWVIDGIDQYPENKVVILNRWGDIIFEAEPYQNDWAGQSQNKGLKIVGDQVVDGTYFYILDLGNGEAHQGFIELRRQ